MGLKILLFTQFCFKIGGLRLSDCVLRKSHVLHCVADWYIHK